ncbi:iron-sulfur cluster repair di-iron protein [soil metagenome]
MSEITLSGTVGQIVTDRPSRSRVFQRLGIDFCCGGKKSLEQACRDKHLDPHAVLAELRCADQQPNSDERNWAGASLRELADHIEQTHHAFLKTELPRLEYMVRKVAAVHGHRDARLEQLANTYARFKRELEDHMASEEQRIFPACCDLEESSRASGTKSGCFGDAIQTMEAEHTHAGDALAEMRRLTDGYKPPSDACNTYRATLAGLAELESDMHVHVHKENSILFPKALAMESSSTLSCAVR